MSYVAPIQAVVKAQNFVEGLIDRGLSALADDKDEVSGPDLQN